MLCFFCGVLWFCAVGVFLVYFRFCVVLEWSGFGVVWFLVLLWMLSFAVVSVLFLVVCYVLCGMFCFCCMLCFFSKAVLDRFFFVFCCGIEWDVFGLMRHIVVCFRFCLWNVIGVFSATF